MTNIRSVRSGVGGRRLMVIGAILLALGAAGVITYVVLALNPDSSVDSQQGGAVQSLTVIGAAIAAGTGALLLVMGLVKRRRALRHIEAPGPADAG